jgi:hypothetical protein
VSAPSPTPVALLEDGKSQRLQAQWQTIQGAFVDEPLAAVQQADALVSELIAEITRTFADELGALESQWRQGSDVSTEQLRLALQQYRALFNRLSA